MKCKYQKSRQVEKFDIFSRNKKIQARIMKRYSFGPYSESNIW